MLFCFVLFCFVFSHKYAHVLSLSLTTTKDIEQGQRIHMFFVSLLTSNSYLNNDNRTGFQPNDIEIKQTKYHRDYLVCSFDRNQLETFDFISLLLFIIMIIPICSSRYIIQWLFRRNRSFKTLEKRNDCFHRKNVFVFNTSSKFFPGVIINL
jgi:hypothetical protein